MHHLHIFHLLQISTHNHIATVDQIGAATPIAIEETVDGVVHRNIMLILTLVLLFNGMPLHILILLLGSFDHVSTLLPRQESLVLRLHMPLLVLLLIPPIVHQ